MRKAAIAWLGLDGTGGGHTEEGVVRIPGTLPGDEVTYTEQARKGHTVTGALQDILTPSPDRIPPPCLWDAACGGCDLAAMRQPARHAALSHAVARGLGWEGEVPVVASPRATGHRARIKLALEGNQVGYRSAGSHDLVTFDLCRIARPELMDALPRLRAWLTAHPDHGMQHVELRTDGERVVFAFGSPKGKGFLRDADGLGDVAVDGKAVAGTPVLALPVCGLSLQASSDVFFQVNLEINSLLVQHVMDAALAVKAERVLDLYAGIGNIGLPIAAQGIPVVSVERQGRAIADLKATAARLGLHQVESLSVPAERFDPSRTPFDVAVVDPPRAGAGAVLGRVLRNRPRRLIYVACHLPAAARDLRAHAKDYRLSSVTCFDLFPETHHIETVMVLDRA